MPENGEKITLCGYNIAPEKRNFTTEQLTLQFITDTLRSGRGAEIQYSILDVPGAGKYLQYSRNKYTVVVDDGYNDDDDDDNDNDDDGGDDDDDDDDTSAAAAAAAAADDDDDD